MQVLDGIQGLRAIERGAVVTVGNFDGVHRGHLRLFGVGRELAGTAHVVAVTFEPHPLVRLKPEFAPPRLTPLPMKHRLLEQAGVDVLVELPPDPEVLSISARTFFELLAMELRVSHLVEGPDFNFGKGREGNITNLRNWATGTSMQVHVVDELMVTLAEHAYRRGPFQPDPLVDRLWPGVRDAAICLGRPYTLCGPIVMGFQRGRLLGMPTANFDCGEQMIPADGVYAGRCSVGREDLCRGREHRNSAHLQ